MFKKDLFTYSGGYLSYDGRFVARFKYRTDTATNFKSFLIKNFTPAEYFGAYERTKSPRSILQSKGYLTTQDKKFLRDGFPEILVRHMTLAGFSLDQEGLIGFNRYIADFKEVA